MRASSDYRGGLIDRSGTITTGGTSQQLAPSNALRRYLIIQNLGPHDLWLNFGSPASAGAGSILLAGGTATTDGNYAGGSFVMDGNLVSTDQVNVYGATTGAAFSAKEA